MENKLLPAGSELAEYTKRWETLRNLVEGLKQKHYTKNSLGARDRNLLDKLPTCSAELEDALHECYLMARRGKTRTVDEWNYEVFWKENEMQLYLDIVGRKWEPSSSKAFVIHDPVDREIFAAMFRDRIIHHFLYAVVAPWWDKQFIYDSYSCRRGRGTDFGIKRLEKFMRSASRNGKKKIYVIKGDLVGYFMSLDRKRLYKKVLKGLKKQFPDGGWLFEVCTYLWKKVIFDDPCLGARIVGDKKDWNCLPDSKTLFKQPKGRGIVIGNLTSQLLSNIMLNEFDWFMKKKLGFKYYGRYVDDFFIVVTEDELEWAKQAMREEIPNYLRKMGLKLHPKKIYIQPGEKGCPFLGKMVRPYAVTPGRRYKRNMRRAFRQYVRGEASYETMQSYVGQGKTMAAYKQMKKVVDELKPPANLTGSL